MLLTTYLFLSWDAIHCGLGMSFLFISNLIILIALFWIVFSIHLSLLPFFLFLAETVLRKPHTDVSPGNNFLLILNLLEVLRHLKNLLPAQLMVELQNVVER